MTSGRNQKNSCQDEEGNHNGQPLEIILADVMIEGLLKIFQSIVFLFPLNRVDQTVFQMIGENNLGCTVQGFSYGGDLQQDIRTVSAFTDHSLHRSDMAFDSGQSIDYLFLTLMLMIHKIHPPALIISPGGGYNQELFWLGYRQLREIHWLKGRPREIVGKVCELAARSRPGPRSAFLLTASAVRDKLCINTLMLFWALEP